MKKHYFLFALLFSLNFSDGQIINFPDIGFKTKLLQADTNVFIARNALNQNIKIDTNNNGEIEVVEALTVYSLNVTGNVSITDLTGIENFTTLREIQCSNQSLSSLNVTSLINLEVLFCNGNNLTNLNVSGLINLKQLYCSFNLLTNLNLSNLTNLERAICSHNDLTSLNLSNLTSLKILSCADNELTTVDVSDSYNLLTFSASNNLLTHIKLKNGSNETSISFQYNPNIQYICVDDSQITTVQDLVTSYGYVNCNINSYCSFNPGGTFYTIQGSNKYDENNNGCNVTNSFFPNLKLTLSDGTNSGSLICDTNGNYECNVQSGTHAITPILENPSYFSVSPTNVTVTFPTTPSPFIQNFCITPNGIHNDLEVVILPLNNARPGFDANYKISYKNKGTHTQSGNVNLTFNDAGLDFVTATPPFTSQVTNVLNWSFTNLAPFETREILFTLNVNSPTETPAVNSGDVLNYTTVITGLTDETPSDNSVALNQTVVNALDPNDKKCLEGNTIPPNMVGEYVHYIIRFENSGTANAQNIVVMDRIDTNRFEISSLLPISGSDSFVTRITDTNKVEFIFENISLPFDNANNDGYVAFKIKTKPTLVLGDAFSNTANIYFDYNFPILTNVATTTIQTLANPDFEFGQYFSIAPNPTAEILHIKTQNGIVISAVSIYNVLGQLTLTITNPQSGIDVSGLDKGSYFIKVNSDKGSSSAKFIKE